MLTYYLIAFISILIATITFTLIKAFTKNKILLTLKITSIILALVLFFRYFLGDDYLEHVINLELIEGFSSKTNLALSFILTWVFVAGVLLTIFYPFFYSVKTVKILTPTFSLLISIICLVFLKNNIIANFGPSAISAITLRAVLLSIETGLSFAIAIYSLFDYILNRKEASYKINYKSIIFAFLSAIGMLLATFPHYGAQLLLNPLKFVYKFDDLNLYHRLYIYPVIIIPIVLYLSLKNKSYATKKFALLFYSIAQLYLYSLDHKFIDFTSVSALPFHLCNTALYITPLCLMFNGKKVFYFTYFINVLGAFLAMAMPNFSTEGLFAGTVLMFSPVLFFRTHWQAFFMPLLTVALGIFPRPRLREFK
ncbi:MAG: YwaF family protein, partial [Clostridia bacterium]|nr:YwaF family protein [Clostridia bacterium]